MSRPTIINRWQLGLVALIAGASVACQTAAAGVATPATETVPPISEPTLRSAPAPTAAETVAYQYMAARDQADAELALTLFADNAITVDSPLVTIDHHTEVFELFETLDWRWEVDQCIETESEPPAEVTCTYSTENAWSRALGVAPIDGQIRFAVENGRIVQMYHDFNRAAWSTDVERLFQAWLTNNHPTDVGTMWEPEGFTRADDAEIGLMERLVPRLTPESLGLYERYAVEFADAVG